MPQSKRTALLAGATGLVGSQLLELLLRSGDFAAVHTLVRTANGRADPHLVEHVIRFEDLDEYRLDAEITDAFCCLGTTIRAAGSREAFVAVDRDYVVAFARLARRSGCSRLAVVSAVGADRRSLFFYSRVKGEMESALMEMDFDQLAIVRPSLLLGARDEFRLGEAISTPFAVAASPLLGGSLRKYRPVGGETVARLLLNAFDGRAHGVTVIHPTEETE